MTGFGDITLRFYSSNGHEKVSCSDSAGASLNRLELGAQKQTGLHKIHADADAIESFFIEAGGSLLWA